LIRGFSLRFNVRKISAKPLQTASSIAVEAETRGRFARTATVILRLQSNLKWKLVALDTNDAEANWRLAEGMSNALTHISLLYT